MDGRLVFPFFDLVATHGVPLELVVRYIHDQGHMPDWTGFIQQSVEHGWHRERTINRLESAVREVYGDEWGDGWRRRMDHWGVAQGLEHGPDKAEVEGSNPSSPTTKERNG